MLVKNNMKDLRDLNEEEFKEVYEYLREKTNNFNTHNYYCVGNSLFSV